jgi:hypothetical protein
VKLGDGSMGVFYSTVLSHFPFFFFFCCSAGDQTQGLGHARQVISFFFLISNNMAGLIGPSAGPVLCNSEITLWTQG